MLTYDTIADANNAQIMQLQNKVKQLNKSGIDHYEMYTCSVAEFKHDFPQVSIDTNAKTVSFIHINNI